MSFRVIKNDYISIRGSLRTFTAKRLIGADDKHGANILYANPADIGTSKVFVSIDGKIRYDCSEPEVSDDGNAIVSYIEDTNGVECKRTLEFASNPSTNREDALAVSLTVTNTSDVSKSVGSHFLFDTNLGDCDSPMVSINGSEAIYTVTKFKGDQVPSTFDVADNLTNPLLACTGYFPTGEDKPDEVQITEYVFSNSIGSLFPDCKEGEDIDDIAVNAIWYESPLAPGESRTYTIYYGANNASVDYNKELEINAVKTEENFEINSDKTGYNPVSLTGSIKNAGIINLNNAELNIELPEGVSVLSGESTTTYSKLKIGQEEQMVWQLSATPSEVDRNVTVVISGISDEFSEPHTLTVDYFIPAISSGVKPTEPTTEATEPTTVATEPVTEATEPTTVATEPVTEATEPTTVATEPVTEATEPTTVATEPVTEATEPTTVVTEPVTEATEPTTAAESTTSVPVTEATDVTSATGTTVNSSSTADQKSTADTANKQNTNAVQTGDASMALVILAVLVSASSVIYFTRKKADK